MRFMRHPLNYLTQNEVSFLTPVRSIEEELLEDLF
jgi:hypothetical protein